MLLLKKKNMGDSLDMCPRRHRELLWRHKGDWKRPESNSNGLYSTAPENTSPNSNFPGNVWKINLKISEYNRITFWKIQKNQEHLTYFSSISQLFNLRVTRTQVNKNEDCTKKLPKILIWLRHCWIHICRDRCDRRWRKFFVNWVNFSVNNANHRQSLHKLTNIAKFLRKMCNKW